jgi:hypothetical protein
LEPVAGRGSIHADSHLADVGLRERCGLERRLYEVLLSYTATKRSTLHRRPPLCRANSQSRPEAARAVLATAVIRHSLCSGVGLRQTRRRVDTSVKAGSAGPPTNPLEAPQSTSIDANLLNTSGRKKAGFLDTIAQPASNAVDRDRALEIASILTSAECERVYLTFLCDDIEQRAPLKDAAALATAVHLVRLLAASMRVHVAFCAHDLLLWKLAGAQSISTGKWMNVRRFWPARWQEEEPGGLQVAYWSEDGLLTLIRDQEVLRLDRASWFATRDFGANPASAQILEILRRQTGEAWLRLSGIQFLRWAVNTENLCQSDTPAAANLLSNAHANWGRVLAPAPGGLQMLFVDRFNTGEHATAWANAYYEGAGR